MKKHVIWSNDYATVHAIEEDLIADDEALKDDPLACAWSTACDMNAEYLEDERHNLDIEVGNDIVLIGDLGLWDGRHSGYKELHSSNVRDCLTGAVGDCTTWYVDELGDLRCEDVHHDGTNHYTYRAWKGNVSNAQREAFLAKVYNGTATRKDITRYTRSLGSHVADVYGWTIPGRKAPV